MTQRSMTYLWARLTGLSLGFSLFLALFTLAVAQSQASCGGSITIGVPSNQGGIIDPEKTNNVGGYTVSNLIADTLVRYESGKYVPQLAQSWKVSSDGTTYTFHLRNGVRFHNGKELTAEDVKASIDRITDPNNPLPAAGQLSNAKSVDVVDEHTVAIHLKHLDPEFLLKLGGVWIVEAGSIHSGGVAVGSGPYIVAKDQPGQKVVFKSFDDYWGGKPCLDEIVMKVIPDPGTMVLALESGAVDGITNVPPKDVARLAKEGFNTVKFGAVNIALIAINNKTVSDVNVRKAICYAVDRNVILKNAYASLGTPATTVALPNSWVYDKDVPGYSYNPEKAKQLLKAAGYVDTNGDGIREKDGKPLNLNFQARGQGAWILATQIIQQFLHNVGIGTTIHTSERTTYYTNVRTGKYDIAWWIDNTVPQPPIYMYAYKSSEYWNVTQQPRPKLDTLIEQGASTLDRAKRAEIYGKIQQIVYDEAIQCPQFWIKQVHAFSPKLENVAVDYEGALYNAQEWAVKQ